MSYIHTKEYSHKPWKYAKWKKLIKKYFISDLLYVQNEQIHGEKKN